MTELLTPAAMATLEADAIARGDVTGAGMMARAGDGIVAGIARRWPALADGGARALVLCGPGNNGGDGYVVARLLAGRGVAVTLAALAPAASPDAAAACAAWRAAGGAVRPWDPAALAAWRGDLVVDALFGGGLSRPLEGAAAAGLAATREAAARRVAVDGPSGLSLATGGWLGAPGPRADLTVTFHRPRVGHYLADGPAACGALAVADIGLPATEADRAAARAWLVGPPRPAAVKASGHKYDHGHAVVVAGGPGRGGAARLAARAALRAGAGLVTVAAPPNAMVENAARLDAVMLRAADGPEALAALLADRRVTAVALGPGLGVGAATRATVAAALEGAPQAAVVLDADALTSFEETPAALHRLTAAHGGAVLTPHAGEFRRLFPDLADAPSRLEMAEAAADRAGAVVLLKGPDTVIAAPGGDGRPLTRVHAATYERAAPWLATAGAGDVLTGLIAGLAARRIGGLQSLVGDAAWLHVAAALHAGPGLIAEDLPEALPAVFRDLSR